MIEFDAVVLAGGAGSRLGGVSKADVLVGGVPLLDRVLAGLSGAHQVVVVGPADVARPGVLQVQESPPGGGPVAGLAAGLAAGPVAGLAAGLTADPVAGRSPGAAPFVVVLACDAPRAPAAIPLLLRALTGPPAPPTAAESDTPQRDRHLQVSDSARSIGLVREGVGAVDGARLVADGRPQHLVAVYRREALVGAFERLGDPSGASMRALVDGLVMVDIPDVDDLAADADTWPEVRRLDARLRGTIEP